MRNEFSGPHDLIRTSDNKILFLRRWNPSSAPVASILIFHGITAYSGPYGQLIADELSKAGFAVYGLDLRGHGLSDGKRGDYPSRERFEKDLIETTTFVKSKSKKLIALGHSLGGLTAIASLNLAPQNIDGLILISIAGKIKPGAYPKPITSAVLKSLLAIALLRGTPLIDYRRQGMKGTDDPLFNFKYSARFYSVLYGTGALKVSRMFSSGTIDSPNLKFRKKLEIPILVVIGDQDEIFSSDSAKEFFNGIDSTNKEFAPIQNGHHAYFPPDCWKPLVGWLNSNF